MRPLSNLNLQKKIFWYEVRLLNCLTSNILFRNETTRFRTKKFLLLNEAPQYCHFIPIQVYLENLSKNEQHLGLKIPQEFKKN